jgi:formiminoglutamase
VERVRSNLRDRWPSAATLLSPTPVDGRRSLHLLGAHTYATSVTPRSATSTPAAVRTALERYSTYLISADVDVAEHLVLVDHGDIADPDDTGATTLAETLHGTEGPWVLLGGDNALTWRALTALAGDALASWGLITLDAHLDMRDGVSNGSPVRQLLAEGLDGRFVVQVGLADFSNSASYAADARRAGVTLIPRVALRRRPVADVVAEALAVAGAGGRPIYVDIDMDVCDRAVVPGCPAAAPGGLSADELREAVGLLSADPRVRAIDFTEVDVERDTTDQRTIRLTALAVLEAAAGCSRRPQ